MDIQLRDYKDSDFTMVERWLNQPRISKWYAPIDEWLDELKHRESEFSWLHHMIVMVDEKPIGFCQYYDCFDSRDYETWVGRDFDAPNQVYSIDYLIGDEKYVGKGLGKKLIATLTELVFSKGATEIIVSPDDENHQSNAVLLANGYVKSETDDYYAKKA
ncbi:GNAT family N-acetyltransferase [Weissella confusa]|uniref:GNAT family N-acetyltransferase n=1 Tax=Weissella confusa TaxID=1583 RepID=UPI001081ACBD|nr:GNAT family N-acetyltransferase [Weissella confusa]MED4273300.1 GNAT family N-acetyltransferase [Weissella confusa]TGE70210.1 N-acetyltransferase [Weissella confusa]